MLRINAWIYEWNSKGYSIMMRRGELPSSVKKRSNLSKAKVSPFQDKSPNHQLWRLFPF